MAETSTDFESDLVVLERGMQGVRVLQELGNKYGIYDIFQDNGGKVLQCLILLGLKPIDAREGNDAVDADGYEYELKTINTSRGTGGNVTTHHHLNLGILAKYRAVRAWYVGLYDNIHLTAIYRLTPDQLSPYFDRWESRLYETNDAPINNPKFPVSFVKRVGEKVWPVVSDRQTELLPDSSPLNPEPEEI